MLEAALVEEAPVEEAVTVEEEVGVEEPAQAEEFVQKEQVLAVIQRHSDGVSIIDIGNELGVDWRSITEAVQSLVNERKIERIDSMYYPGDKAGEEEI